MEMTKTIDMIIAVTIPTFLCLKSSDINFTPKAAVRFQGYKLILSKPKY